VPEVNRGEDGRWEVPVRQGKPAADEKGEPEELGRNEQSIEDLPMPMVTQPAPGQSPPNKIEKKERADDEQKAGHGAHSATLEGAFKWGKI
jgi:hypothetical protein